MTQTVTTPVGAVGNDRPITRVCETWTSPELKLRLLQQCSDPRARDTTERLININRAEPDPSLFQVPAGYTIVDETGQFTMTFQQP